MASNFPDELFRTVVERCSHGLLIWDSGSEAHQDWRLLYLNRAASEGAPFDLHGWLGKTVGEVGLSLEQSDRLLTAMSRARADGEVQRIDEYQLADARSGGAGYYRVDVIPVGNNLVALLLADISAEVQARVERQQSEDISRTLFERSSDIVAVISADGRVVRMNRVPEPLSDAMVLGSAALPFVGDESKAEMARAFAEALRDGIALFGIRGAASGTWYEGELRRIRLGGEPHLLAVARDVTKQRRDEQLRARFLEHLIAAEDEFRRKLARELHDETSSALTAVLMGLGIVRTASSWDQARKTAAELETIATRAAEDLARIARGLHPSILEHVGLTTALRQHGARVAQLHGIRVRVDIDDLDTPAAPPLVVRNALYRIVQEALTNAAKHASPTAVRISIARTADDLTVSVCDDGSGFDPRLLYETAGLGLIGIRERATLLGGRLEILSAPGEGTEVRVRLPLGPPSGAPESLLDRDE